jgi:E3 SUMO-protein ligase PIAS1
VDDILRSTPPEVEQVMIEPNGNWSNPMNRNDSTTKSPTPKTEEDDLIEIKRPDTSPLKHEQGLEYTPLQGTPASREPSSLPSARLSGNKRSAAEVIDLTGSDDEDVCSRPTKRLAFDPSMRVSRQDGFVDLNGSSTVDGANFNLGHAESPSHASQYHDI